MRLILMFLSLCLSLNSCRSKPSVLNFCFVGDVMFDRNIRKVLKTGVQPFENVQDLLHSDFLFANLETTIATNGFLVPKAFNFMSDPQSLSYLTDAGFSVVSVANNHSMDYGFSALCQTFSNLRHYGIRYVGAGASLEEALVPVILETNGIRMGLLAFGDIWPLFLYAKSNRAGIAPVSIGIITQAVRKLRKRVDFVVVSLHWGFEYEDMPKVYQRKTAHQMIDSGADLVLGHHPHNLQGIESYRGKMIFYSLGNFIFDQRSKLKTRYTLIGKLHLKKNRKGLCEAKYSIIPLMKRFDNYMPDKMDAAQYRDWAFRMIQLQDLVHGLHLKAVFLENFTNFEFSE